ncbi:hypothetical protein N7539_009351 [Penicillium diatomitis]|uniref:F-box domain-containing protein n=1 Tax=Penicillium diatomitis TaxID=2819901 RepID=A0A9X0BJV5_9EURO|nr:uncharacterized protein N7539_009351 [Penicillium diatomitis]KAJ5469733.1 hypothetical protein N7539_009351 [Penicillium diatomitis]
MSGRESQRTTSQPPEPTVAGLFVLPVEVRYRIFKLVLAVPDSLYLFQDRGSPLESFMPYKPHAWLALLYTCRRLSYEARSVLYGANRFTLEEVEIANYRSNILRSFIKGIGSVNAGFLSNLRISFPATERVHGQEGEIRLREDDLQNLQLLQNKCTGLGTLEALIYGQSCQYLITEDQDNPQFAYDLLAKIDSEFRKIASLGTIIVRYCSGSPDSSIRDFLESMGWVVLVGGP